MDTLNQPLSPAELDELDELLASPQLDDMSMDVPMLEGYLTALVIGPRMVMPTEWLPWVWDRHDASVEPDFADIEHAKRAITLVMRFMNGIADTFLNEADAFEPIFLRREQRGAAEWCEGFLIGTDFCSDEWAGLWDEYPELAAPFDRLGTDEGRAEIRDASEVELWSKLLLPALVAIHELWLDVRMFPAEVDEEDDFADFDTPAEPYVRPEPKVGRNDPCPCGSGKKFKKCCGAGDRSVH